ncbi:cytochrome P450 CYP4/CYP19/CYP26 subfamily [Aspergillus oryzae 100-8]|uniref:Cytochrome protein n=1 Tax=Aspergillus oryzae (strain 3.042) TaxID=1160506 RepID=I8A728_ASPO3|nr:cytochrome protein [Aspergillus oryzae 3.042]KDE80661.1 cytochrome P450 CYP4/CYP19/CYP26 subfamily [Aspergillus oryzae 100-8]|eukprot:EIT80479.1 cytochrome protein [Aspergillus oryzae 3.042]
MLLQFDALLLQGCKLRKLRQSSSFRNPPRVQSRGPLGIYNVLERLRFRGDILDGYLARQFETYGFTHEIKELGLHAIITAQPENVRAILSTDFESFGPGKIRKRSMAPLLGEGLFTVDGEKWKHARNMLRPLFVKSNITDMALVQRHLERILAHAIPDNDPAWSGWTEPVDLKSLFERFTMDTATESIFGRSVDSQLWAQASFPMGEVDDSAASMTQGFARAFDVSLVGVVVRMITGRLSFLFKRRKFRSAFSFVQQYVSLQVHRLLKDDLLQQEGTKKPFLAVLMEAETLNETQLHEYSTNLLIASRNTTAALLSFTFALLSLHPDILEKLRSAILDGFSSSTITAEKLLQCEYLQWVLREVLRLFPPIPITGVEAKKHTALPLGGGEDGEAPILIPKDQLVIFFPYFMHRRRDIWGDDAESFRPERWAKSPPSWAYVPFSGGPRTCLGKQYALIHASYVVTRLLQSFSRIRPAHPTNNWLSAETESERSRLKVRSIRKSGFISLSVRNFQVQFWKDESS